MVNVSEPFTPDASGNFAYAAGITCLCGKEFARLIVSRNKQVWLPDHKALGETKVAQVEAVPVAEVRDELLEQVKAYASDHYEEGYDVFVEAYTDEELREAMGPRTNTLRGAIRKLHKIVVLLEEKRASQAE